MEESTGGEGGKWKKALERKGEGVVAAEGGDNGGRWQRREVATEGQR